MAFENPFRGRKKAEKSNEELPPPKRSEERFAERFIDYEDDFDDYDEISGRSLTYEPLTYEEAVDRVRIRPGSEGEQREAPPVPEILDNISFTLIRDNAGGLVKYKSSAMGRKEIVLSPSASESILFNLDTGLEYRVRIVGDTNPNDPNKGSYLAEVIRPNKDSDRYEFEHRGAQVARARRLAGSYGFKELANMLNADPDLSAEYRPVVARHKEYRGLHTDPEERHRNFTGMLSGIMMSERGNNLLNRTIDRTIDRESDEMKERILESEKPVYVPSIVVGAGVYGAILATSRQMQLPDVPELTIEQGSRIGGQFAQYQSDLFRLNSRRRPEQADKPHLPGTAQSLNSAGTHAVMHSSDTGMESYAYQSTISDTSRVNFFLAGKALTGTTVQSVSKNPEEGGEGKFLVECVDAETGKVLMLATDRVTFSTGIGEEVDRLDPRDKTTRTIIDEEKQKFKEGKDARVLSLTEFGTRMSDPTNPFPLKGMKRIVLSGTGDSASVIAGILLGYESQVGKTATQLDNVEEIIWLGQDLVSKEEFLENCRVRYAQIGLDFPRDRLESYYHRIKPVANVRSSRLQRTADGGVRVLLQEQGFQGIDEAEGKLNPTVDRDVRFSRNNKRQDSSREYLRNGAEGDYFIYAHGFDDKTDKVLAPLGKGICKLEEYDGYNPGERFIEELRDYPVTGETIYYKKGPFRKLEIVDTTGGRNDPNRLIQIKVTTKDSQIIQETIPYKEFKSREAYFQIGNIAYGESAQFNEVEFDSEFAQVRGQRREIAKVYDVDNGGKVYKVGPVSNLELSDEERDSVPALTSINENTAAIFRYVDLAEALSERLADEDKRAGVTRPELFTTPEPETERVDESYDFPQITVEVARKDIDKIGLSENSLDLLRLGIGSALSNYRFSSGEDDLEMYVKRETPPGEDAYTAQDSLLEFQAEAFFRASSLSPTSDALRAVISDPLVAGVLAKITENMKSSRVKILIPMDKNGKADAGEIRFATKRI